MTTALTALFIAVIAVVLGLFGVQVFPSYPDAVWTVVCVAGSASIVWLYVRTPQPDVRAIAYPNNTYAVQVNVRGKWVTVWSGHEWVTALQKFKLFTSLAKTGVDVYDAETIQIYRRGEK